MDVAWTLVAVGGLLITLSPYIGGELGMKLSERYIREDDFPKARRIFNRVYHLVSIPGCLGGCVLMMASFLFV